MDRDATDEKRIPGSVKVLIFLLIIAAIYFGRRYYTAQQHPYKDLDVIGAWDYAYSVTFDVDGKMVREDKDLFSREMYRAAEIELRDDGSFSILIDSTEITGTWAPNDKVSNVFHLYPESADAEGIIQDNEIRWDKGEDRLCIALNKENVPGNMKALFQGEEVYRYIFCKTYRDNVKVVYRDGGENEPDPDEEEHWHLYGIGE